MSSDRRLERAIREHRAAVARYIATAEALDSLAWSTPWAEGKWSPAETTEHLILYCEVAIDELRGAERIRVKVGPVMMRILRWILLPHILFHRSFPLRARAPRAIRPTGAEADSVESLRRLKQLSERLEEETRAAEAVAGRTVTHPYFGWMRPAKFLQFSAVHLEHHHRHLRSVALGEAPVERA